MTISILVNAVYGEVARRKEDDNQISKTLNYEFYSLTNRTTGLRLHHPNDLLYSPTLEHAKHPSLSTSGKIANLSLAREHRDIEILKFISFNASALF